MPKKSPLIKPGSSSRKRHLPDPRTVTVVPTTTSKWPVLLVDDEPEVHRVTEMALDGVTFDGRPLELIKAFSAQDAREILEKRSDIAAAIVDVVMETEHAGLDLVEWIRTILGNTNIRIVLRTGQPGQAPEREIITRYDINDYKEKTELTARKMHTLIVSCLRSWRDIKALETNRHGLDLILKGAGSLFSYQAADRFAATALRQFHALIHAYDGTSDEHIDGFMLSIKRRTSKVTIMTGYGRYNIPEGSDLKLFPDIKADIEALEQKFPSTATSLYTMDGPWPLLFKLCGGCEHPLFRSCQDSTTARTIYYRCLLPEYGLRIKQLSSHQSGRKNTRRGCATPWGSH